jgi:hypothetical protein
MRPFLELSRSPPFATKKEGAWPPDVLSLAKLLARRTPPARRGLSSPLVEEHTRKWLLLKELAPFRKGSFKCGLASA